MRLNMVVVVDFAFGSPRALTFLDGCIPTFWMLRRCALFGVNGLLLREWFTSRLTDTRAILGPAG